MCFVCKSVFLPLKDAGPLLWAWWSCIGCSTVLFWNSLESLQRFQEQGVRFQRGYMRGGRQQTYQFTCVSVCVSVCLCVFCTHIRVKFKDPQNWPKAKVKVSWAEPSGFEQVSKFCRLHLPPLYVLLREHEWGLSPILSPIRDLGKFGKLELISAYCPNPSFAAPQYPPSWDMGFFYSCQRRTSVFVERTLELHYASLLPPAPRFPVFSLGENWVHGPVPRSMLEEVI